MNKKRSKLAIASLVLGLAGAWSGLTRAGQPPVLSILLGLASVASGVLASWSIRRSRGSIRGIGMAVSGAGLGAVVTLVSFLVVRAMVLQQFGQQRGWQQDQDQLRRVERAVSRNRMPDQGAASFTSNLPIVLLQTAGPSISSETPTVADAQFFDTGGGRASLGAKPDYGGWVTIHRRGHSSLYLPKSSYTFHTVDRQSKQIKVALLGLPREEDWVLYAPFEDKTLIRDVLAYELARRMGHYAPRTRFVELFLKTSNRPVSMRDYAGVYVLMEKIKRGPDRVNIAKLEPTHEAEPEITGGYIIKRDHGDRPEDRFRTTRGGPYFYVYPKAEDITARQKAWLTQYFHAFESALSGPDFADPQTGYAAYLEVDSFIDAHWLIEASKNVDGFRYSAFLTKDRGGKLKLEPPWDWNRSFGNANYYDGWQTHGWYWTHLRPQEISWYRRLQEDPDFAQRCQARWLRLREDVFDPKRIRKRIDELAALLDEAQKRNYQRWPVLGLQVTCNFYVGPSYEAEVRWLNDWMERRIAWIDSQVGGPTNL